MMLDILYPNLNNFEISKVDSSNLIINADIITDSHVCCPFCNSFQIKNIVNILEKLKNVIF
ncbi:hypothetical protein [Cetobacterium somerae]|uniref:hypothetical protein n=1 Tax=Cetobacterium somerae TaxID=188913 RepID=UPI00248E9A31|nr:hypothetical protein [Cetobacterium somerae]